MRVDEAAGGGGGGGGFGAGGFFGRKVLTGGELMGSRLGALIRKRKLETSRKLQVGGGGKLGVVVGGKIGCCTLFCVYYASVFVRYIEWRLLTRREDAQSGPFKSGQGSSDRSFAYWSDRYGTLARYSCCDTVETEQYDKACLTLSVLSAQLVLR